MIIYLFRTLAVQIILIVPFLCYADARERYGILYYFVENRCSIFRTAVIIICVLVIRNGAVIIIVYIIILSTSANYSYIGIIFICRLCTRNKKKICFFRFISAANAAVSDLHLGCSVLIQRTVCVAIWQIADTQMQLCLVDSENRISVFTRTLSCYCAVKRNTSHVLAVFVNVLYRWVTAQINILPRSRYTGSALEDNVIILTVLMLRVIFPFFGYIVCGERQLIFSALGYSCFCFFSV